MSQTRRTAIAKLGGVTAHKLGKAHRFTREEAIAAGKKGGRAKKKETLKN